MKPNRKQHHSRERKAAVQLLLTALLAIFGTRTVRAGTNVWKNIGPEGGSVSAIAIDPQNKGTLYYGTFGGALFKSTDGGMNWILANSGLPESAYVRSMVIDPQNPSTLYAGTWGGGVF